MSQSINLSRNDAWLRVSQYFGAWLVVWLLIGIVGQWGLVGDTPVVAKQSPPEATDVPMPPVLLDHYVLRGQINRKPPTSAPPGSTHPMRTVREVRGEQEVPLSVVPDSQTPASSDLQPAGEINAAAPPGFADLIGIQNTQADVYFQDRQLISTFIEYDLEHVWFLTPEEVVEAVPTLVNPERVLAALTGKLDSNSHLLCSVRVRTECGELKPDVAGVIFNEGKFRIDLFIAMEEQEVQLLATQRYLPAPTAGWATLHDMSFTAAGQFGDDRFNLNGESYLSKGAGRARVRYGLTNSGPALREASWQWDNKDREYEIGAFRTARGSSVFVNDQRLLGLRLGSSIKTRTDLDNALATPVFAFLERRARVDILRDGEILDSRYYQAGNHQLDTTRLPDGAYDITVRKVAADGSETLETHFFVRDSLLPPLGEKQYYVEAGAFTQPYDESLPRVTGGAWLRGGISHRLSESFALEGEALFSGATNLVQAGAYFLGRGWQLHTGLLASDRGDTGVSVRGQWQRKGYAATLSGRHLSSKTGQEDASRFDPLLGSNVDVFDLTDDTLAEEQSISQQVLGGSYTQASASLSFPLRIPLWNGRESVGRAQFQARYNKRGQGRAISGFGFNYRAPLFKRRNMNALVNFEGLYSSRRSIIRLGFDLRWRDRGYNTMIRPEFIASESIDPITQERSALQTQPTLGATWNRNRRSERFGDVTEGLYVNHDGSQSILGGRASSQTKYGFADVDLSWADGTQKGFGYAANSRFSLVSTEGKSALGGGSRSLAAIVVEIDGDLPEAEFQVLLDRRVAGYATTDKRGVITVRPYESYNVRIAPTGDEILGYDERTYEVTLFPGNVHRLVFSAHALHVLVSQAVMPDGSPIAHGKFTNVDGYAVTDEEGWFQIEVAHKEPLSIQMSSGEFCALTQPERAPEEEGLAVVDALVCRPVPAPVAAAILVPQSD